MTNRIDFNDENSNTSANPSFDSVLQARLSRRTVLRGSVGTMGTVVFGGLGSLSATACGGGDVLLGFDAVAKSQADVVSVPAGYTASVLYALGDPLTATTPAYKNDGTDTDFENRAGDHHDGMEWFGLGTHGKPSANATARGLIAMNHEATTDEKLSSFFLHANGGTSTLPRPAVEVDKETAIHGVSVVEVKARHGKWSTVPDSAFNFRLTALSENILINGPARGNALLKTKYSPDGTKTRGTLNNCGTGKTPWGTFLTGEENWAGYFTRSATDDAARGDKSVAALRRYGRNQGAVSRHGWESGGSDDKYARWNNSKLGTSVDGSDDYRNEMNSMGYIVELDAYDKNKAARKRSALGRFAHESAAFGTPVAGQPLAVYMGDDSRGEYIYKFVSAANWAVADANPADRITTGDKYLDNGKLYVAKFNSDGKGAWVELSIGNSAIAGYAGYTFADQADVLVNARLAADAVGATKMDRPEWCSTNIANGEVYFTLTNNSNRRLEPSSSSQMAPDSANPRVYTDLKGTTEQKGNPNGHILRLKEDSVGNAASSFTWDVYVFGAESSAAPGTVNLSSLTDEQDFSSPDGLVFSPSTGIMWIQTDDGAYTDVTNCMMLAALPGQVGDGAKKTLNYTKADGSALGVDTFVGKAPGADKLKRFLVGAKDCEITGLCETPDGKAMFINIQHPGEGTKMADIADPTKYTSQWPSNAGYGAGKRPRSATIVITKDDGGRIGT
ncbi:MAG: PhoX family phosphatase [Rhodoferax sp.]|uniref:PhoX family protein n=1 Tax=Rhodoferax sp. TaxID=50421 RepID=UPI00271A55F0|nr:PhoX family phosphatase [Rhodoferax sp.]MDO8447258.1 PhoX family phosphatase [Rhodoferax sp.]